MIEKLKNFFGQANQEIYIVEEQVFVLYTTKDFDTHQIFQKKIPYAEDDISDNNLQEWKRVKILSYNIPKLLNSIKGEAFIDPSFPHTNQSITDEELQDQIRWKRIPDLIKYPVYASVQTFKNFERISLGNKKLKQALVFMYRTHPSKFKELLAHETSTSKGIYEYKLYYKGIIRSVIIDDFIPMANEKIPFMSKPVAENEIFPMLIEKAIAKVCGKYSSIPENVEEILEILFCGPLRKSRVDQLSDTQKVRKTLQNTLKNRGIAGFMSKKNPKIRSFGINESELYHIVNRHSIKIKNEGKQDVYELISQKKLSAWSGKFSHNDSIWEKVDEDERSRIFSQLFKNKSFLISSNDISRIFQYLIVFDGTDSMNKQWIQNESQVQCPSFCSFQLTKQDQVFIRASSQEPVRTSLIIAKQVGSEIKFIKGVFHQGCQALELTADLDVGKYVICIHHDWILNQKNTYAIFLSSGIRVQLKAQTEAKYPKFLQKTFTNILEIGKNIIPVPSFLTLKQFYSIGMLAIETGFSFINFDIRESEKKNLVIEFDEKMLFDEGWQIIQPYKGRKWVMLQKGATENILIILKTHKHLNEQKLYFPATAFKIKL